MPGIIVIVVISIMIMNHYGVTMITPMITAVVVIMIMVIYSHCHNSKGCIIGWMIGIGIRRIIGYIHW